jgi:hypothetical protein
MKYHFFSAIGRIEQHKLFFGHPYYYKNVKDIEKRLSAWNAFGSYAIIDPQNLEYLESGQSGLSVNSGRDALHTYAQQNNIKVNPNRANIDQISYIVLKDEAVKSTTASKSKSYGENKDAYTNDKSSAKQDAAAFCTIDFFRKFYSISTGVTPEMMEEFKENDKQAVHTEQVERPASAQQVNPPPLQPIPLPQPNEVIPEPKKQSIWPPGPRLSIFQPPDFSMFQVVNALPTEITEQYTNQIIMKQCMAQLEQKLLQQQAAEVSAEQHVDSPSSEFVTAQEKANIGSFGNYLFWLSFCILGQPVGLLMYYRAYYIRETAK